MAECFPDISWAISVICFLLYVPANRKAPFLAIITYRAGCLITKICFHESFVDFGRIVVQLPPRICWALVAITTAMKRKFSLSGISSIVIINYFEKLGSQKQIWKEFFFFEFHFWTPPLHFALNVRSFSLSLSNFWLFSTCIYFFFYFSYVITFLLFPLFTKSIFDYFRISLKWHYSY